MPALKNEDEQPKVAVLNGEKSDEEKAAEKQAEKKVTTKSEKADVEPENIVNGIPQNQASPDKLVPADGPRYLAAQKVFMQDEAAPSFDFDGKRWRSRDDGQQIVFEMVGDIPVVKPGVTA